MGFWSKLGQTALRAAPYVAAPFTGGASLLATGAANQAANKWADKSAQGEYEKTGIAPSRKFDTIANIGGSIGSAATGLGALGKLGGGGIKNAGMTTGINGPLSQSGSQNQGMDWSKILGGIGAGAGIAGALGGMRSNSTAVNPTKQSPIGPTEEAVGRMENMTPNLEQYISQGHEEALYDQPWRKPYPADIYKGIGGNRRFQGSY